ncbi:DUF2798 domain-containing protein [Xanthomonas arboricola]|uniref:DUF2798 domain-containing protein n=1 Tax=Xanthomonas arboricola TaxID=56448 RepID=UPI002B2EC5CC|nr:DUF2798 domain-containing protein [Xanthomonas arboricola]
MNASKSKSKSHIIFGIPKLPARYASLVMPFLLSIFMSGVVSVISTYKGVGTSPSFVRVWLDAWIVSWVIAFPALLLVLPVVRRITSIVVRTT